MSDPHPCGTVNRVEIRVMLDSIGARLYISGRTVQTRLAHIFAKLDIASRAQLAAQVTRHQ
jgi:DNA-binding CsgD family transcriptional regulator